MDPVRGDAPRLGNYYSRPAVAGRAHARKGRKGDAFYLSLSTWRPWREVLGFFTQRSQRAPEAGKMPALHAAKSGQEIRAGDIFMLGDCAEEGVQSADS